MRPWGACQAHAPCCCLYGEFPTHRAQPPAPGAHRQSARAPSGRVDRDEDARRWLKENRHLRYMWIPYTQDVVVVKANPTNRESAPEPWLPWRRRVAPGKCLKSMRELLVASGGPADGKDIDDMSMTQMRDALIAKDPLNRRWIARVNGAEAEFWRQSAGSRVDWSDQVLGFDCGGQQWVLESAFNTGGTADAPGRKVRFDECFRITCRRWHDSWEPLQDLEYMDDLLDLIERHNVAAPAPIEQRWTSSSSAPMSPAHSSVPADVHSWVGVIMYLPTDNDEQRTRITSAFKAYAEACERELFEKYDAKWHWAKLEPGTDEQRLTWVRKHLRRQYKIGTFNTVRHTLDPENNFGNAWLNAVIPLTRGA